MRTIAEAIQEVKKADPQTAFTQTALRRMLKTGELPSIKAGTKYLVNLDVLFNYLNNPAQYQSTQAVPTSAGGVHPINEKIYN
jgi:hypothetical protein